MLAYEAEKEKESLKTIGSLGEGEPKPGWEPIPDDWTVPSKDEVMEFLVERRKSRLLERLI